MSPPERPAIARLRAAAVAATALAAVSLASACGKSDLRRPVPRVAERRHPAAAPPAATSPVKVPLPLTAARAASFSAAVSLTLSDVPGASIEQRSKTPRAREKEASRCGGRATSTVGGGQSPSLLRGRGLDRETLSSSVEVLSSARVVQSDLAYANSRAGLACYARVLGRSLAGEEHGRVRLLGVRVSRIHRAAAGAQAGSGVRIAARVGIAGSGVVVSLYVDALAFAYGPAEIDLYGTSFVQPVPGRTEQELLTLLRERARLHPL